MPEPIFAKLLRTTFDEDPKLWKADPLLEILEIVLF